MAPGAASRSEPSFKLGKQGLTVPMELHKVNRMKLSGRLHDLWAKGSTPTPSLDGVYVLLQGGSAVMHGGSDVELNFRQVSKHLPFLTLFRNRTSIGLLAALNPTGLEPSRFQPNEQFSLFPKYPILWPSTWVSRRRRKR